MLHFVLTPIRSTCIVTKLTILKERLKRRPSAESPERKMKIATTIKELEAAIETAARAQQRYAQFDQARVDEIFRRAAFAANDARIDLARLAADETGMGVVEDKVIKNHFAAEYVYNRYKDTPTCGVIERDLSFGIEKIAEPIGLLAGIVPVTNPTATTIFKALLALKTRNGILFSPHPRAAESTAEAARIIDDAAVEGGAPSGLIACIGKPNLELSQYLMQHPKINLILATGGAGMVKAAYSSGKPAIGVGAGNTPAIINESADVRMAVSSILMSKTFDNGVICASEQAVIVVRSLYEAVRQEFVARGAVILNDGQKGKLSPLILKNGTINSAIVGQSAEKIAAMAGFKVPPMTKVLIAEVEKIGKDEPFSHEKLSPVLALYAAENFEEAMDKAQKLVEFGGTGHTAVLYTDPARRDQIEAFGARIRTGRLLVNMPSSQGAIGDIYNFRLEPSLTLGCGSWGGNSVSENVGVKHLLNIKTVAERRENMLWFKVPPQIYIKPGSLSLALRDLKGLKRAFIVTDKPLFDLKFTDRVTHVLDELQIDHEVFSDVEPDPSLTTVRRGLAVMKKFNPDVIIALGGGSPMDAAKIMRLMYEHPEVEFEGLALRFMDIRKRIYEFPKLGRKAKMVAIPTTSGTGSEVTPFAVVTDDRTGMKYPIADYELTPDMAIVDSELVLALPPSLTAYSGIDALTHALEAMVSVLSTEFTNALALEAIRLLLKYLPRAYQNGAADPLARERVHHAGTMAGMAFANSFLGVCHSMAHKLGATFHIPHGLANALLINQVIRYNASDVPFKQTSFPQYSYPTAKARYARIADHLCLGGNTPDEKVEKLIAAISKLKMDINIPSSIQKVGVVHNEFIAHLDKLAADAFDDQCTGANPRYPLITEIKDLFLRAYEGKD
jgi:acetaldehyde dehydrogenase/alcohol dehydrogenase